MTDTFRDLGVAEELCTALEEKGITHPFPIQALSLPLALAGNDLIGQARTGTGKTLAFGLPLLQRVDPTSATTQALVIVPTRELCIQVTNDLTIGRSLGLQVVAVYGGVGYDDQNDALTSGAHVVVGTPGRLIDHLNRGNLDLSHVTQLVLDEADEMLDMGFLPDVERLVEACTAQQRHTMLFSATMPTEIVRLGRRYMDQPTFTRAESQEADTAPTVAQHFFQVHRMDKPRVLARILQAPDRKGVFVFVRTKHMADRLVEDLRDLSTPAIAIHGDLRQATRERNLDRFRTGKANVLVATEVAARGLDVTDVTHVVNYDCPDDEKMYLHRIGRTARAGQDGVAITFAEHNETARLDVIRKALGASDNAIVEVFSTSDKLTELFGLPEDTPWGHFGQARANGSNKSDTQSSTATSQTSGTSARESRSRARRRSDAQAPAKSATNRSRKAPAKRTPTDTVNASRHEADNTTERTRTRARTRTTGSAAASRSSSNAPKNADVEKPGGTSHGAPQRSKREASGATRDSKNPNGKTRQPTSRKRGTAAGRATSEASRDTTNGRTKRPQQRTKAPAANRASSIRDTSAPRGDGQPQIARQVKVEHLP